MALTIRIENTTAWPTRMLRPFVVRIVREEFPGTKSSNTRSTIVLRIGYNRGAGDQYCSGHAYLNSSIATVNVPNPVYTSFGKRRKAGEPHLTFPVLDFCHVVGHEFGHCKGIQHKDMALHYGRSCARGTYSGTHYDWAKALPVPVVREKVRATTDEKRRKRLDAAKAAVLRWTRKRKLAETKLRLWSRKVLALERTLADVEVPKAACAPPDS